MSNTPAELDKLCITYDDRMTEPHGFTVSTVGAELGRFMSTGSLVEDAARIQAWYDKWLDSNNVRAELNAEWAEEKARKAKVVVHVPVDCLVTVEDGKVTLVTLLPKESSPGYFGVGSRVIENNSGKDEAAVLEVVNGSTWEPLESLPPTVVWEG